jgi:hypothetical protein
VPHGTAGAKVLVTNLTNYAQPLIRYEVPDRVTLSDDLCPCGRPFTMIARIDPRPDPRFASGMETRMELAPDDQPTMIGFAANGPLKLVKPTRPTS